MRDGVMRTKGRRDEKRECALLAGYLLLFFLIASLIALLQPHTAAPPFYGNPPDESARYLVSRYICRYGRLPNGFDPEVRLQYYGISYAFYTMLPYIVQGFFMRFVNLFTDSELVLLYAARFVNVACGTGMAALVYGIGRRLFREERFKWLFCLLVMYMPQSLFLHTYVNTDSMVMFSAALIAYGLVRGYEDDFSIKSCLLLAAGIIICALSYYNAYGNILCSIFLFLVFFLKKNEGAWRYEWKNMLKKGCLISAVVLLGVGWYFIRNAVLYDGDFLGLNTMLQSGLTYGDLESPPYTSTYRVRGISVFAMLTENDYFTLLLNSFIARYGSMSINAPLWLYRFYKAAFLGGFLGWFLPRKKGWRFNGKKLFIYASSILCILIPLVLCIYYAYAVDYQYQGRYVMPGLIPFMYFVTAGLEKWTSFSYLPRKLENARPFLTKAANIVCRIVLALLPLLLLWMVFGCALPIYRQIGSVL